LLNQIKDISKLDGKFDYKSVDYNIGAFSNSFIKASICKQLKLKSYAELDNSNN